MSDKRKDPDLLGDLGSAFDDLYEEAQDGLREAEAELRNLTLPVDEPAGPRASESVDATDAGAKASDTASRRAPLTGAALHDHQRQRVTQDFDPTTEREFNTDARDLQILEGQLQRLPSGHSTFDRNVKVKGLKDTYRRLGRQAAINPEWKVRVPRSSDPKFRKEVEALRQEFDAGFDEVSGVGPQAPRSSASPGAAVKNKPLVGEPLAAHREVRATDNYDPTLEREFNTDAADLMRYQWAKETALENSSEHVVARDGAQGIVDRYRKLGKRAKSEPNVRVRVPRTNNPKYDKAIAKLKKTFDDGRNEP